MFSAQQSRFLQIDFPCSLKQEARVLRSEPLSSPDRELLNFVDQNLGRDRVMLRHSNKVTLQLRHQASCAASRT